MLDTFLWASGVTLWLVIALYTVLAVLGEIAAHRAWRRFRRRHGAA